MSHAARAHAVFSPSSSKRWMECPGSIALSEGIEQKSSIFADEGTAAHMLAEHCYQTGFDAVRFAGQYVDIDAKKNPISPKSKGGRSFLIDDEMVDGVSVYLDFIRSFGEPFECEGETRVDLTHLWPDQFGTADFMAYHPDEQHLHVADFKYGRGVAVQPEENTQGLSYAAGAVKRYHNRGVAKVTIHVIQPRAGGAPVRSWETSLDRIAEFGEQFTESAKTAMEPDAPLSAGEWCKFCPAIALCPRRVEENLKIAQAEFGNVLPEPVSLSAEALGGILARADELDTWVRRVREHAHAEALAGNMPTGFKLVAKRATRKWKNPQMAATMLPMLFDDIAEDDLYEPRELLSPAKVEALMPGKNKKERAAELEPLVHKQSSGVVLALESDPRAPVKADAASEFGAVE